MAATSTRDGDVLKPPAAYGTFSASTESSPTSSAPSSPLSRARSSLRKKASPFSRLFFLWFDYLVEISKTRAIRLEDVFELDEDDRSAATHAMYIERMTQPRDFVWVTLQLNWRSILASGVLSLVAAVGDALNPFLMYVVITAVMNQETSVSFIVGALVARHFIKAASQLARQHAGCIVSLVANRTLGALHTLVFDATISSSSSQDATVSQAANRFFEVSSSNSLVQHLHAVWLTPLRLAANLYLLYYILGKVLIVSTSIAAVLFVFLTVVSHVNKRFAQNVYKHRGRRLQIMSECFKAIQSIKLNAWEPCFLANIRQQREKERTMFRAMAGIDAMWRSIFIVLPEMLLLVGAVVGYSTMHGVGSFNAAAAFASLSILNQTRFLVTRLVMLGNIIPISRVAAKQIFQFLEQCEKRNSQVNTTVQDGDTSIDSSLVTSPDQHSVRLQNATIGYAVENPQLVLVNLDVAAGSLIVIHGNTGAGKSTLLEAMIDKALLLNPTRGSIHVRGPIAYCSQDPWLQTLSIRDNILFGLPFDEHKYLNVLHACCLLRDLSTMAQGDDTVIGPKGLTLSGGQKARIALARACYADADVYVLDSVLSSVDAIVQGDIFRRCIIDLLRYKTVVLATHNAEVISSPFVDQVVLVKDHRVMEQGLERPGARIVTKISNRRSMTAETRRLSGMPARSKMGASRLRVDESPLGQSRLCLIPTQSTHLEREWRRLRARKVLNRGRGFTDSDDKKSLQEKVVESALYYVKLCGSIAKLTTPLVLLCGLSSLALVATHFWLCSWRDATSPHEAINVDPFVLLIVSCSLLALGASIVSLLHTSEAGHKIFDRMARGVLMAPMSFFYRQPIGTIINRFTTDMRTIDEDMDFFVLESIFTVLGVILAFVVLIFIVPELLCIVPALIWMLSKSRYQWPVAMQINQFSLGSSTPCYDSIFEAVSGRQVIQAFGAGYVNRFRRDHHKQLDRLLHMQHAHIVMHGWIAVQFLAVESLIFLSLLAAVVVRRDSLIPLFGLALHYVVTFTTKLYEAQLLSVQVATAIMSIHHAQQYAALTPEQSDKDGSRVLASLPPQWPHAGEIVFDNVSFTYDDDLSEPVPVLQNINLHIRPGEKIGLVGRTGAGKSSLTMALFRIHELVAGRILIDGVDIALADVYAVRSRLSIIPQSPLFFQGTLRSYLDPFDEMEDVVLWEALGKTGLSSVVTRMEGKLVAQLQENAENLSLGERQLLCLSRVLLKQSRVVVLDEATAAMDHASDEALQRVLQVEFRHATVISIAHRLDSIMAFDRVCVLEDGRIVQCGSVEELVSDATGPFFDLLEGALLKM